MYRNHSPKNSIEVRTLGIRGPPSSLPIADRLRSIKTPIAKNAKMVKRVTEKASEPGSTWNAPPFIFQYTAATDHATPIPRNTFTALLPVTFPTHASAYWSWVAANLLAKVSGKKGSHSVIPINSTSTFLLVCHPSRPPSGQASEVLRGRVAWQVS